MKEPVGFLPFSSGIAMAEHLGAFDALAAPGEFWTPWPVPSVAKSCPAFAPDDRWVAGPNATPREPHRYSNSWNGPNWPRMTSAVLDALACGCRLDPENAELASLFAELFRRYTLMQYRGREGRDPCVVEEYDPLSGDWLGQAWDCFDSTYIDLIVRHVVGLQPRPDNVLEIWPIDVGLDDFAITGLPYRGHSLDVDWNRADGKFLVRVDGAVVAEQVGLYPIRHTLPD